MMRIDTSTRKTLGRDPIRVMDMRVPIESPPFSNEQLLLDEVSIDLNGESPAEVEINGWSTESVTTPWPSGGQIMGRPSDNSDPFWASIYDAVDSIDDWTGIDLGGATGDWTSEIAAMTHANLFDILGGTAGDDHNGTIDGGGYSGNYPYVSTVGDWTRNAMLYGLADSGGNASVDVTNRYLVGSEGENRVVWEDCQAFDASGNLTLDWGALQLAYGPWSVTNASGITPGTAASGALQVAGGASFVDAIQALGVYLIGSHATNYWDEGDIRAAVSDVVSIGGGTCAGIGVTGGSGFSCNASDIIVYAASGKNLKISDGIAGTKTATWKRAADLDPDDLVLVGA